MLESLLTLPRARLRLLLYLLLIIAFCVPALVASLGFYRFTKISVAEDVESGLALLAQYKAGQVHDWIAEREYDLGALSRLPAVQAGVAGVVRGDPIALDSVWTRLDRERRTSYADRYQSFVLYNADRTQIAPPNEVRKPDLEAFAAARAGTPAVSTRRLEQDTTESVLEIYIPLLTPSGSPGTVLVAGLSPAPIYRLLGDIRSGSAEQVHLADSTGKILSLSDRPGHGRSQLLPDDSGDRQSEEPHIVYRDERGVEVVGIQRDVPGLGWKLLIERDRDDAYRRVIHLRNVLWVVMTVIFVLGNIVAVVGANLAVSRLERRELELRTTHQQLITADRLASVGMMAASVAHEINNPLTTIKVLIHSLREHLSDQDTQRNDLGIILTEIDKIKAIVLRFLQFARPRDPEFASVDLSDTLTRIVALVRPQAQGKGLTLAETYTKETPPVWADASQIGQVFLNILLNALDATPRGGGIRVSTAAGSQDTVVVTIWNSGPGLPPELEERIFEPFFSTKPTGTGLGLSIARTIVGKHRGTISAKGFGDRGTSFIISLKASDEEKTHASRTDR